MEDETHHDENMMIKVVKDMSKLHINTSNHGDVEFVRARK